MQTRADLDLEGEADLCTFCYPPSNRDILYEDENVYVLTALGQFIEGYVLLIEKEHVDCFAEVWDEERIQVKREIAAILEEEYGSYCFFEHGRTGSCMKRGSDKICFHAHIHCLPVKSEIDELVEQDYNSIEIDEISELMRLRQKNPHYFFVETFSGSKKFFPVDEYAERQYLKKKVCEAINISKEKANYEEYPFRDKMSRTSERLEPLF